MQQKNKRKTHLKPHSRTANTLIDLVETADNIFTLGYNPVGVMRFGFQGLRKIQEAKERKYNQEAIRRLKERGLIEEVKTANKYRRNITNSGNKEYLRLKLGQCDLLEDNQISVVAFDIPESQRRFRDEVRELLKEIAFIQIQRSVWISPFDVGHTLMKMLGNSERKWVRCFIAKEVM